MSLNAPLFSVIPEDTQRVAKAAFPKGNRYLQLRDTLGPLFFGPDFQHLFPKEGRPAEDPARLALVTVLQFAERLSDEQAANAVRSRIDWKYLLALPLEDAGLAQRAPLLGLERVPHPTCGGECCTSPL